MQKIELNRWAKRLLLRPVRSKSPDLKSRKENCKMNELLFNWVRGKPLCLGKNCRNKTLFLPHSSNKTTSVANKYDI